MPLDVEPRDDVLGLHPVLQDLQRDLSLYRLRLGRQVDDPESTFAEDVEDVKTAVDRGPDEMLRILSYSPNR